jgi:hypothetical protein
LNAEHHAKAFSKNGIFHPVVVSNGRISGTWQKAVNKDRIVIRPVFFEASGSDEDRMRIAENRYGDFFQF